MAYKLALPVTGKFGGYVAEFDIHTDTPSVRPRWGFEGGIDSITLSLPNDGVIHVKLWNTTLDAFDQDALFTVHDPAPPNQDWRQPPPNLAEFRLSFILPA